MGLKILALSASWFFPVKQVNQYTYTYKKVLWTV